MAGFIRRWAGYVMRGRQQAVLVGLLFTVIPLLGWVSNVVVALFTLRKGAKEGAIVLLWVILPVVVVAFLGNPWMAAYNIIGGSLTTYLLALVLRETQSWKKVLEVGMVFGLLAVLALHLSIPDVQAFWLKQLSHYALMVKAQFRVPINMQQLQSFSTFATGFQVALLLLGASVNLILARSLQSMLYNPRQFRPELELIRLSQWDALTLVVLALFSLQGFALARDALPVTVLVFILAGLSAVHAIVRFKRNVFRIWFLLFYALSIVFFPYLVGLLVILAITDSCFDLRRLMLRGSGETT